MLSLLRNFRFRILGKSSLSTNSILEWIQKIGMHFFINPLRTVFMDPGGCAGIFSKWPTEWIAVSNPGAGKHVHVSTIMQYLCTVHVYMYTCTHVHMYTCTHVHMYTCTHVHMYTCTHVHMYMYMYMYMYTCTHVHAHVCTMRLYTSLAYLSVCGYTRQPAQWHLSSCSYSRQPYPRG